MSGDEIQEPNGEPRGRTSHTAAKVARGVVFASREPVYARLMPEGAAASIEEFALASGVLKPWMCRLFEQEWYRRSIVGMMGSLWPGELMRLVLRKRFMDDEVRAAIKKGATQLLIVGAGFDTLGLRIARAAPDVRVVEMDTPATAAKRLASIQRLELVRPNHAVMPADLDRVSLGKVLEAVTEWDVETRTVVVAEGVLMYLTNDDVIGFLSAVREQSGQGSCLVFSYLMTDREGRPNMGRWSGLSRVSLRLVGEPLRWGLRDGELESFLDSAGFHLLGPPQRYDFHDRYLAAEGVDEPVANQFVPDA